MKIAITAESTIDLSKELLEEYDIKTLPFQVLLNDVSYFDGEISTEEIINIVEKTKKLPKTSAVNSYQYEEFFKFLSEYDAIIHLSLSSKLSSAYNNACITSEEFDNVYVIDTRALSTGIALLAIYARSLATKGLKPEEIVRKVKSRIPYNQTSFILKRLDYLYKGGRCSALSYLSASLLKIRPQIIVSDGKMMPKKKYVGKMESCALKYVNDVLCDYNSPDLSVVFITYTTAQQETVDKIYTILKNYGFKKIYITKANATITSHCGEGCLGILYLNDGGFNA